MESVTCKRGHRWAGGTRRRTAAPRRPRACRPPSPPRVNLSGVGTAWAVPRSEIGRGSSDPPRGDTGPGIDQHRFNGQWARAFAGTEPNFRTTPKASGKNNLKGGRSFKTSGWIPREIVCKKNKETGRTSNASSTVVNCPEQGVVVSFGYQSDDSPLNGGRGPLPPPNILLFGAGPTFFSSRNERPRDVATRQFKPEPKLIKEGNNVSTVVPSPEGVEGGLLIPKNLCLDTQINL